MQILSYPVPLILYLLALVLHFLPCFLPEGWRGKLRYANICFHIAIFVACLLSSVPLEEVALLFLFSLLLYLASAYILEKYVAGKRDEEAKK